MTIKKGMSRGWIRRELNRRVVDWLVSIDDDSVRVAAGRDTLVTGGAIASMLLGEPVNDLDIYFKTITTAEKVAKYYAKLANGKSAAGIIKVERFSHVNLKGDTEQRVGLIVPSSGIIELEKPSEGTEVAPAKKYQPVFVSENAITLSDDVQIITRFFGTVEQIHKNFDFVHATCSYEHDTQIVTLPPEALELIISRTLFYSGSLYPLASLFRLRKFIRREWSVNAGQLLKIAFQIADIDFTDADVLREQLTGVDQAYMNTLIVALSKIPPEKFNGDYVGTVIDKIFEGADPQTIDVE